jgi:pectinesterase
MQKKWIAIITSLQLLLLFPISLTAQQNPEYPSELTVAADGTGNYKTIGAALNAFRAYSPVPLKLHIKNGTYHEKVVMPHWLTNITIDGESKEKTIITYDDYSGKPLPNGIDSATGRDKFSTFNSYTLFIQGNDVIIRNLTIQNTSGRVGQAVALHVEGDRVQIENCKLLGNQDTLLTANDSSRQYYFQCYIEGTTDFIFGPATVIFESCTIKSLTNSFITAASTTQKQAYGYVFKNCKLIANEEATKVFLGRPWRPYARTVYMNTEMGNHIRAEGWDNWRNPENEKTAYYAEYQSKGPGANNSGRVKWSHQLTKSEAEQYTTENIFGNWKPQINKI